MTTPVYVPGMHISDNGELVIDADELAAAGVRGTIEIIEGEPPTAKEQIESNAAYLESRIESLFMEGVNRCMRENADECPYPEGSLARYWETRGYAYQARAFRAVELQAQLDEANARREAAHAALNRAESEHLKACAELDEANAWAEAAEKRAQADWQKVQAIEAELTLQLRGKQAELDKSRELREAAEARAADLAKVLEKVEWVNGWDVEGRKATYCPWCNRIKGFGHTFGCVGQLALNPDTSQSAQEGESQ